MRRTPSFALAASMCTLLAVPLASQAKWAGGIILLPGKQVSVDGQSATQGTLKGGSSIKTHQHEARVYVRGASGQALAVLAAQTTVSIAGSASEGFEMTLESGAVRVVRKPSPGARPLEVVFKGKTVDLDDAGGIVLVQEGGSVTVLALDSAESSKLFPQGAPAAARGLGLPATGLPLVEGQEEEEGAGGTQSVGDATEIEGESKCLDSSSTGPEATDPTTDGTDGTEIDRTRTRARILVSW